MFALRNRFAVSISVIGFVAGSALAYAADIGTAFTYQGQLEKPAGVSVEDTCDFRFSLFDAPTGGSVVGDSPQTITGVAVTRGVFTTTMDFGVAAIDGTGRWLGIEIQCSDDAAFVPMDTRVELKPAPYSIRAAAGVGGPTALNVTEAGDVGIGTGAPAVKLEVAGNMHTSGELTIGGTPARSDQSLASLLGGIRINGLTGSIQSQGAMSLSATEVNINGPMQVDGGMAVAGPVQSGSGFQFPDGSVSISAPPPSPPSSQIAMLRWDLIVRGTFPVGDHPWDVAFDGTNIWVTNTFSDNVTKVRASDGTILGTFATGDQPIGAAFDGENIWIANNNSSNVTKLRASDGANLGTIPLTLGLYGVAFDGANIWVVNQQLDNVTKLRASDGVNLGTFAVGDQPIDVAYDGTNIWTANFGSNSVSKLRASDGANMGTFAVSAVPGAIAFDGSNIWASGASTVTKLRASDGANLGTFAAAGSLGVAFDGANIWVTNHQAGSITKLRASDGANLGTFATGSAPRGVVFDGTNIWVANSGNDSVSKIFLGG